MPDPDTEETPEASPPPLPPWGELGLTAELLSAIGERGYELPTPVQAEAIPAALQGRDLLVRSKTGTGKTAAFMIPVLDRVPAGYRKAASITLCPTRELAIQIAEETRSLCKDKELEIVAVYGLHVYWTDKYQGTVRRAALDGSGSPETLYSGGEFPVGLVVTDAGITWTDDMLVHSCKTNDEINNQRPSGDRIAEVMAKMDWVIYQEVPAGQGEPCPSTSANAPNE